MYADSPSAGSSPLVDQPHAESERCRSGRRVLRHAETGHEHPGTCRPRCGVPREHAHVADAELPGDRRITSRTSQRLRAHRQVGEVQAAAGPARSHPDMIVSGQADGGEQRRRIERLGYRRGTAVECRGAVRRHPYRQEPRAALLDDGARREQAPAHLRHGRSDARVPGERQFGRGREDSHPVRRLCRRRWQHEHGLGQVELAAPATASAAATRSSAPNTTASGFPAKGRSVNTSTISYERLCIPQTIRPPTLKA